MIVSKIKANNLCKPPGIGKDDSSSRRVGNEVADQMIENGAKGMTQIETQPGDTLESVAKGHLQGSGQKVDLGNLLFEQHKILNDNHKQIKEKMRPGEDPKDLRTFRGRELPQGIKINLSTTHTQFSNTPSDPVDRSQTDPSNRPNGSTNEEQYKAISGSTTADATDEQNQLDGDNSFAGAGSMSNTGYALELHNVGLSDDVKKGMNNFMKKNKVY